MIISKYLWNLTTTSKFGLPNSTSECSVWIVPSENIEYKHFIFISISIRTNIIKTVFLFHGMAWKYVQSTKKWQNVRNYRTAALALLAKWNKYGIGKIDIDAYDLVNVSMQKCWPLEWKIESKFFSTNCASSNVWRACIFQES